MDQLEVNSVTQNSFRIGKQSDGENNWNYLEILSPHEFPEEQRIPLPYGGLSPVSSFDLSALRPCVFERSEFRQKDRSARLR